MQEVSGSIPLTSTKQALFKSEAETFQDTFKITVPFV